MGPRGTCIFMRHAQPVEAAPNPLGSPILQVVGAVQSPVLGRVPACSAAAARGASHG